mmetsp:Transcript_64650/g.102513  ORF Transcript_64650/g.102513 Transcript_64650/m.102513 type:complete len:213 (-) Transcript_64650:31-669(-)
MPFLYRLVICTALLFTASQASRIAESRIANAINSEDEAEGVKIPQSVDPPDCETLFPPPVNCFSNGHNDKDIEYCPVLCKSVEKKKKEETKIHHAQLREVERGHQPATVNDTHPAYAVPNYRLKHMNHVESSEGQAVATKEAQTGPNYLAQLKKGKGPSEPQHFATNEALPPTCLELQAEKEKGKKVKCSAVQRTLCDGKKKGFCAQFESAA